jgi:hypothetical protein
MKFVKQRVFQIACDYEHRAKPMSFAELEVIPVVPVYPEIRTRTS